MEQNTISILGCGWLGLPLAKELLKEEWNIKGSTTSEYKLSELKNLGISPYIINICNSNYNSEFFNSEYLLVNIPPSKTPETIVNFTSLCTYINNTPIKKVILVSSTSAYPNTNTIVDESYTDSLNDSTNKIIKIEKLFQNLDKELIVVRLAGLVGPHRHPGRFFAKGKTLSTPDIPVNIIHLDDCLGLIKQILKMGQWGEIYNGCASIHPSKEEFYKKASQQLGVELKIKPSTDSESAFKIVSNIKSIQLGYHYKYDDPMDMLNDKNAF